MISCSKTSATIRKTFKTKPPLEALFKQGFQPLPFGQPPHLFGGAYLNLPQGHHALDLIPQKHFMFLQKYKGSREIISLAGCGAEPHERMASFL